jgi:flagellar FliL protein
MKRMVIFIIVGLTLFAAGIGGGMFLSRNLLNPNDGPGDTKAAAVPGPIISVGEFTVNLAGTGNRISSFTVSLELLNTKINDAIKEQNWAPRIRNEILLIAKDKVYEDLTKAEGVVQFGEQIKRVLNTILPLTKGEVAIVRVMFETFVLQ